MKAIAIPTCDRPHYLERVLESVRAAMAHSPGWTIVFSCEPHPVTIEMARRVDWANTVVSRNVMRRGIWTNTFLAIDSAVALRAEFVLYLEDDNVVSEDALVMADQFSDAGLDGLIALRRPERALDAGRPAAVSRCQGGLLGDGFGFPVALWPVLRAAWFAWSPRVDRRMWDWAVEAATVETVPYWRPMVNRSRNIGTHGNHGHAPLPLDPNHFSPAYEGPPVRRFEFVEQPSTVNPIVNPAPLCY